MNKITKILLPFAAAASMLFGGMSVSAESEYKVYDFAYILSDDEMNELEEKLQGIVSEYGHDVVVFTSEQTLKNESIEEYAKRIYDENKVGINGSGIIYVVDMQEREYDIYAEGTMRDDIMVRRIRDDMASDLASYLTSADYYRAFSGYADKVEYEINNVIENGPNSEKEGMSTLTAILISTVIALIVVLIMKSGMKTTRPEIMADNYIRKGSFNLRRSRDVFLYSTITRTEHESSSSGSSGGSSDSGHSSGSF